MASERFQRPIDRILDQIEDAADRRDWPAVRQGALDFLVFDPDNEDAKNVLSDAQRAFFKNYWYNYYDDRHCQR